VEEWRGFPEITLYYPLTPSFRDLPPLLHFERERGSQDGVGREEQDQHEIA
jgi:hypothetical protein